MKNEDNAGTKFPPPFIYFLFFLVGIAINSLVPINVNGGSTFFLPGIIFIVLGFAVAGEAFTEFRKNRTTIIPDKAASKLVEVGIYKFTRNPMYLSLFIIYLGTAFILNSVWALILTPFLLFVMNSFVIRNEESYLSRRFGKSYVVYKEQVRRWL